MSLSVCLKGCLGFFSFPLYNSNWLNVCQAFSSIYWESSPSPSPGVPDFFHLEMKKERTSTERSLLYLNIVRFQRLNFLIVMKWTLSCAMNLIAVNLIFEMLNKACPLALTSHTLDLYKLVFYECMGRDTMKISLWWFGCL